MTARRDADSVIDALPTRFRPVDVAPGVLAPIFSAVVSDPVRWGDLATTVERRLIELTVREARHQCEFYRQLYADADVNGGSSFDLRALPAITRADIEAAGAGMRARYARYAFSSYTSGTTRGIPLTIDRSEQEQLYLSIFFSLLRPPRVDARSLVLSVASAHHGRQIEIPADVVSYPIGLNGESGFLQAKALLQRTFPVDGADRRISIVAGSLNRVLQLTAYLSDEAPGLGDAVREIHVTGQYLSPTWHRLLDRFWGAPIVERYSLTELFFGALRCQDCDRFHFDPFGVAEVIDIATRERLENGQGELLLTGLYPFTQMTPLIRYAPGDVADVCSDCCPSGRPGYRLLGRLESAALLEVGPARGRLVTGGDVSEVLDALPEVNRRPDPSPIPASAREAGSPPVFAYRRGPEGSHVLQIELRFSPTLESDAARRVAHRIQDGLTRVSPWLGPAFDDGSLVIELLRPGALPDADRRRP